MPKKHDFRGMDGNDAIPYPREFYCAKCNKFMGIQDGWGCEGDVYHKKCYEQVIKEEE